MDNAYFRLAGCVRYIKHEVLIKIGLSLCAVLIGILQAVLLAFGTSGVFSNSDLKTISLYYMAAGLCVLIRALIAWKTEIYSKKIAGRVKAVLRETLVQKLIDLGPRYQSMKRSGRLQSLVTDGVEYVEPYLVNYLPQVVVVLVSSIGIGGYIFALNMKVGAILIAVMTISLVTPYLLLPFIKKSAMAYWQGYAVLNAQYVDAMQGMNTLKALNAKDLKGRELYQSAEAFRRRQIHWTSFSLISTATIVLMMAVGKYLTVGVATLDVAGGHLSQTHMLIILFLVIECIKPIADLDLAWHASYMGLSVAHELFEIIDEPVVIQNQPEALQSGIDDAFPKIEFRNVTFRYPNRHQAALQNVSFIVEPKQSIAIVGKSGSGKSTITNLLLRFYDVDDGCILINDIDIRAYSLEYLRTKISIVFQDTYLFHGTVEDNMRLAAEQATSAQIQHAATLANAHDFITAMPKSYDTIVGERGATLSGGEKQRIAIARAVLKNAPILVLDEATSSVDAASEAVIQSAIGKLSAQYTTLIIAHRLSTIQHVDQIFVFDKGVLIEHGTHQDLVKTKGMYHQLLEAQAG